MKKITILAIICCFFVSAFSQGDQTDYKKPTIMIVPSDVWCNKNGYVQTFDNQGTLLTIPDYKKAFQNDADLLLVISKINSLMADRKFPLKNLESVLKAIEQRQAEDNMTTSKSGAELAESPLDRLMRTAKADIIIQLTWTVNVVGPKKSITYNLQGLDAYTNKQIAGADGTGAPSIASVIPVLLEEAVLANMDNFAKRLQSYFDDLKENGREIAVDIRIFDNGSGVDLETEYGDLELTEIIGNWMYQNTEKHVFNKSDGSHNYIFFEQVRAPLYAPNGQPMDAETFVRSLQKYLRTDPFKLTSKVMPKGLGRAVLVIGEK